jgi:hypothetical protein
MFAHRLVASGIGGQTVDELNNTMTVDEFYDWLAYHTIEPLGTDNLNAARELQLLMQINSRKGASVPTVEKIKLGNPPKPPASPDQIAAKLEMLK